MITKRIAPLGYVAVGSKKARGFRLIGHCYKNGRFIPGATIIALENGMEEYFSESVSLNEAVQICRARGINTLELENKIEHWVKTGKWGF